MVCNMVGDMVGDLEGFLNPLPGAPVSVVAQQLVTTSRQQQIRMDYLECGNKLIRFADIKRGETRGCKAAVVPISRQMPTKDPQSVRLLWATPLWVPARQNAWQTAGLWSAAVQSPVCNGPTPPFPGTLRYGQMHPYSVAADERKKPLRNSESRGHLFNHPLPRLLGELGTS